MRNPVEDPNAGVQQAPSVRHAARTVAVANKNTGEAAAKAQQINQISSSLGNALGNFMEGKRKSEMEQRYEEAYFKQGEETGLSEYQRDLKRTGFTEFIYGGQSPEYLGALNAAAKNASNSLFMEQQDFVVNGIGADMTPDTYQKYLKEQIKTYHDENFEGAPDATVAFMKNWRENSNELTRIHRKEYEVREQQKAAQTVAEGVQTQLDMIKTLVTTNPDRARQLTENLANGDFIPSGMSQAAGRKVMISELLTAGRAHDFLAFQVLNQSGLTSTFTDAEWKQYSAVQALLDTDNFNMMEAQRLNLESVIESDDSTPEDVQTAIQEFQTVQGTVTSRNTMSAKHLKTVYGSDRHLGVLSNQYAKAVDDKRKEVAVQKVNAYKTWLNSAEAAIIRSGDTANNMSATLIGVQQQFDELAPYLPKDQRDKLASEVDLKLAKYGKKLRVLSDAETKAVAQQMVRDVELDEVDHYYELYKAAPKDRREKQASFIDRIDDVLADQRMGDEERARLQRVRTKAQKQLEQWEATAEARLRKAREASDKKAQEAAELRAGVDSLIQGGGYVPSKPSLKKKHLEAAVNSVADQVLPDTDMLPTDKLEKILTDPSLMSRFLHNSQNFRGELGSAQNITTAIGNIAITLRAQQDDSGMFTDQQKAMVSALDVLQLKSAELYNASFTPEQQRDLVVIRNSIKKNGNVAEMNTRLNNLQSGNVSADKLSGKKLLEQVGLDSAPGVVQDRAYSYYKTMLPLGSDVALEETRKFMRDVDSKENGVYVQYGSTFGKIGEYSLGDVLKIMDKTYRTGEVTKSGWTVKLQELQKSGSDTMGRTLYSLKQLDDYALKVLDGNLVVYSGDRFVVVPRTYIEGAVQSYEQFRQSGNTVK